MHIINVVATKIYRPFDCSIYIFLKGLIFIIRRYIYSFVVDAILFKYFISLAVHENFDMHIMIGYSLFIWFIGQ